MRLKQYLTEAKMFKDAYKVGDIIKVEAERKMVYAHRGYVESGKSTKLTLVVRSKIENTDNAYTVELKGKFTKVHQTGGKIPKVMRFNIIRKDFGELFTGYPKPLKYHVIPE
jgi:transposase-like protein